MAVVIKEETREGVKVLVYDNGMERNAATGRIIRSGDTQRITKENSHAFHRARREKKRAVILEAVNESMKDEVKEKYGEFAFVAAVAASAMVKATTPHDPKSIEAARWLMNETGLGESDPDDSDSGAGAPAMPARIVVLLAELARRDDAQEVIEGKAESV